MWFLFVSAVWSVAFVSPQAFAVTFEGKDIPHFVGMRDRLQHQVCRDQLKKRRARDTEVAVRIQLDPSAGSLTQNESQWFGALKAAGFKLQGWEEMSFVVEGTVPASKLNRLARLKFIKFVDRFDDFAGTDREAKMDQPLKDVLADALRSGVDRYIVLRLRVHLDPDGSQFSFRELLKKIKGTPGHCRVLKHTRPSKTTPGVILFQARTGCVRNVIEFLPGDAERSWAELEEISEDWGFKDR